MTGHNEHPWSRRLFLQQGVTLASLAAQRTTRPFAVIVMENDAEGRAGLDAARPLFADGV